MPQPRDGKADGTGKAQRPYVSIMFECCHVYARAYQNKAGTHYVGWCPRCARKASLKIGDGGTDQRIFRAM